MENVELVESVDRARDGVNTQSLDISFNELVDMYQSKELIINPDFQRLFRWSEGAQSRFIESLLLELPLPPIFLMETDEGIYELIDGLQRVSSYLHFRGVLPDEDGKLREPLRLVECDLIPLLNDQTVETIPISIERKLKRNFVRAEILRSASDKRLRYHMFKRLNTGGLSLEPQEIRNCTIRLLNSTFYDLLASLADDPNFRYTVTTLTPGDFDRRYHEELVLRFFAMWYGRDRFSKLSLEDFLTDFLERASDDGRTDYLSPDLIEMGSRFRTTFELLAEAAKVAGDELGPKIFGAINKNGTLIHQFAVYHFDMFSLGLQPLVDAVRDSTTTMTADQLSPLLVQLKYSGQLQTHLGGGKNNIGALNARIRYVSEPLSAAI